MSTLTRLWKRMREPFPFYFNNDFENAMLVLSTGLFTVAFLMIFQPFGHDDFLTLGYTAQIGTVVVIGLSINIFLLPRLVPSLFDNWDIRRYILFNIWNILLVGILCGIHNNSFCPPEYDKPLFEHIYAEILHTFLIGIVPLFMMTFMIKNRILLENLKKAKAANSSIDQYRQNIEVIRNDYSDARCALIGSRGKNQPLKVNAAGGFELQTPPAAKPASPPADPELPKPEHKTRKLPRRPSSPSRLVIQSDTNESLDLAPESFLYAEAQDNYVKINWIENDELQSQLLRLSMKKLEFALASRTIIRCHRSYLVNLTKVDSVRGNANGYRLHIGEVRIPVSRSKGKFVLKSIDLMSLTRA